MESLQVEEDATRAVRAEPRTWTPIKVAVAVGVVIFSLVFSVFLVVSGIVRGGGGNPPPHDEVCQDLPYSSVPVPAIKVGFAEPVGDWEACPVPTRSPRRDFPNEMCRRYRVPLDYSQGLVAGNITVTVKRSHAAKESDGQLWMMGGGPGSPSYSELGSISSPGKVDYTLDHRGTGWSTLLDCPKVRKQPGNLPWGNSWMKWVGLGNVSAETVDACLAEISEDIGAPKHFTAANAARDLASIIMAIQAETGSTADVGIHGFSYGTVWARRFLELQGQEFPVIVSHVGIDGVCSGDYDYGQYALMANSAGRRLLDEYCDADCRGKLGAPATGSLAAWFGRAVKEIDKAITDGSEGFCAKYLWERFAKSSALSGWTAKASIKEALGAIGYLHVTYGSKAMTEFVAFVLSLRRCVRDTAATTIPSDFWAVAHRIDLSVRVATRYLETYPSSFDAILHHIVGFGDMWKGPPELRAWGVKDARHGSCSLESWRHFFDEEVFWAPDFVTLMSRYQDVFNKYGYRENSALVHGSGRPWSNVTVLVTNGDLDGQTPLRFARAAFEALPTCKAKVELPTGRHCVSTDSCLQKVVNAFYGSPASSCPSGWVNPASSSDLGQALEAFDSGNCSAKKVETWTGLLPVDDCGREHSSSGCDKSFGAGGDGVCDMCFAKCVELLDKANVPNSRCVCASEAARCGARGNCTAGGFAFCSKEASHAGCDNEDELCQDPALVVA